MRNDLIYGEATYDDDALRDISAAVDTSLNGRVLDVDTMQITVKNPSKRAFFTSEEYAFYTADNLRFYARGVALDSVDQSVQADFLRGGSQQSLWYPSSMEHIGEEFYMLNLTSSLGRLLRMAHKGGIYTGQTAQTIIDDICGPVPHYIDPTFRDTALYGHLPNLSPSGENGAEMGSAKDNLLQVLFALNATVRDDAEGVLRIGNLSTGVASVLDEDCVFRNTTRIRYELPVTSVTVLEHQYIAGGETVTLFEGTTTAGQIIVFEQPMSNLDSQGFEILASNANYAVLSAGSGTLTGQAYIHTTREVTRAVSEATIPNPVRIEDATLVSLTNSATVVQRLAEYYAHRSWIECEASIIYEDAGDVVSVWDTLSKAMRQACIERISPLRSSNIMRGTISALIGYTPWQETPFVDQRVLLTGSGTFTVPTGVTQITVVLIGGGGGGNGGTNGADGTANSWAGRVDLHNHTFSANAGAGGEGGVGGLAGTAGKILRLELTVTPGQTFAYSCAAAGAAGAANGGAGTNGGETTFGAYSSAGGSVSASGYTDVTTGITYALPGAVGMDGGNGGKGGSASSGSASDGDAGADVGSYSGGDGGASAYSKYSGPTGKIKSTYANGGAGGGGAANSKPGGAGSPVTNIGNYTITSTGGDGADGDAGASGATYGSAGSGGNAGGGGGGTAGIYEYIYTANASPSYINGKYTPTAGVGGTGGAGGAGMPGCCILYFRQPAA